MEDRQEKAAQDGCPDGTDLIMTVELEDGTQVECSVLTIFPVDGRQYIVLLPEGEEDAYLYRYHETPEGEPVLDCIESDEEYEAVQDRYEEILDEEEFDQLVPAEELDLPPEEDGEA